MRPKHILLILGVILLHQQRTLAQDIAHTVDSLLAATYTPDEPGGVFLVTRGSQIVLKKAYGLANLELGIPMETDHVFEIGSMTKQFTAIAILLLEQQGKLHVEDEITKYIPDYPVGPYPITIHHLLTHTSGIKNYTSLKGLNAIATQHLKPLEVIDFFKDEPLEFTPGSRFKYSNSGYVILGHIIELVSQQTYEEFIDQQIFSRLQMNHSRYADHRNIVSKRASGYHKKETFVNRRQINFSIPYAAGSLMSNVDDMLLWNEAIHKHGLIKEDTYRKVFATYTLNNGEPINYGYGWHIKSIKGAQSFEHGGHIFGFKSMGVYLPEQDIYVIGLNNCDCNSPTQLTRDIAGLLLEES